MSTLAVSKIPSRNCVANLRHFDHSDTLPMFAEEIASIAWFVRFDLCDREKNCDFISFEYLNKQCKEHKNITSTMSGENSS